MTRGRTTEFGAGDSKPREGRIDRIERRIEIAGPLDAVQRRRLVEIAEKCPAHGP